MKRTFITLIPLLAAVAPCPVLGGFPVSLNSGSGAPSDIRHVQDVSAGYMAEVISGPSCRSYIGYFYVSQAAYEAFLKTGLPYAVRPEPAGAASSPLIASADRTMRISWSNGSSGIPVRYRVYIGKTPDALSLVETTGDQFLVARDLDFLTVYYWQIEAFDVYGRATRSAVYSFSIAPTVDKMYCAPNPFRAGAEATTFIFNMPGPGSAELSLYSLPGIDLVYSVPLPNLLGGINTHVYHGNDNRGQTLFNGVYLAVIEMKGSEGDVRQKSKVLVIK